MSGESIAAEARQYLLNATSDEESLAFERHYFEDQRTLEAIAAVEDDLIEEYLDGVLEAGDRARFERVYLVSPAHRNRVDTIRRLRQTATEAMSESRLAAPHPRVAAMAPRRRIQARFAALAAAAVVALTTSVALWTRTHHTPPRPGAPDVVGRVSMRGTPHVFAFAIPAGALRGSDEVVPNLVIPPDTDLVALEISVERNRPAATAIVATVTGEEVWRSPAVVAPSPNQVRIEVPAARLPPDDYIVTLMSETQQETGRYALHVRAR